MLTTERYYYVALAAFLLVISSSFFLFHGETSVYDKVVKSPYRYVRRDLESESQL